jgi:predicted RND superfamily exporter protein
MGDAKRAEPTTIGGGGAEHRPFFSRLAAIVVDRAHTVLAVTALMSLLFLVGISRLQVRSHFDDYLPTSHPYVQVDHQLRGYFGGTFLTLAVVEARSGTIWQPDVLKVVYDLTQDVRMATGIIPHSLASLASPMMRQIDADEDSIVVSYLMRDVPETPEEMARIRQRVQANPLYRNTIVSADERAALVSVDFDATQNDGDITRAMREIAARHASPNVDILVTGQPVIMHVLNEYVAQASARFAAAFAVILLVLYLAFGSVQGMVLPMATALLSCLWALGIVGFSGMALDPFTSVTPILIVAVGAGHSAQVLKRYYDEYARSGDNRSAVVASVTKMGPVMLAAGGTAAMAFGSLALFPMPTLRNFGLVAALGIVASLCLELTFMPALRAVLPPRPPAGGHAWLDAVLRSIAGAVSERRAVIALAFAAVVALSLLAMRRLTYEYRLVDMLPASTQGRRDFEAIRQRFPAVYGIVVGLQIEEGRAAEPGVIGYVRGLQEELASDPGVVRTLSYVDVLAYANGVLGSAVAPDDGVPRSRPLAAQLLALTYSDAYALLLTRDFRKGAVWAFLPSDDVAAFRRVIGRAEAYAARTAPPAGLHLQIAGGIGAIIVAFTDTIIGAKLLNVAAVMTAVAVLAALVLGSVVGGLLVIVPLVVTVLVQFGLMGALGIPLSPSTATTSALSVGIGADYAIYLLYRLREEVRRDGDPRRAVRDTLLTSGRAVLIVALAIGAGYGSLAPSSFEAFRVTGILVGTAMFTSCLSALLLLPAGALALRPRFIFGQTASNARTA